MRALIGFMLAPLVPALLLEALRLTLLPKSAGFALLLYTYPVAIVLGLPAYLAFRRAKLNRLAHYALGGFLGGQGGSLLVVLLSEFGSPEPLISLGLLRYTLFIGALTASCTTAFWVIAIRRIPGAARETSRNSPAV